MRYVIDGLGGPTGGDAWQAAVTATYFPLDTYYHDRQAFSGGLEAWSLGLVGVSKMRCGGVSYQRHKRHFANEREASLLITIPEVSEVQFSQGSKQVRCGPGGFLVERGDAPYEFWHDQPNALWVLKLPTASVRARVRDVERFSAMSFAATQGIASLFVETVRSTVRHINELDEAAKEMLGQHIIEMFCLSITSDDRVLDSHTSSIRAAHLSRAEHYIRAHLRDPALTPQIVAEACGVSLRYLQLLFQDIDKSINGFIRDSRLDHCAEALRMTANTQTIAEIAYKWGFGDQSQFCRHYRARFGCSPRDTRREAGCKARNQNGEAAVL